MELGSFSDFLKQLLEPGYDWHVKLYYPAPTSSISDPMTLESQKDTPVSPETRAAIKQLNEKKEKCIRNWIGEVMLSAGVRGFRYIKVTEDQEDFSTQYHVLFGDVSTELFSQEHWLNRWTEMADGRAYTRHLDGRIAGLLAHLVMRQGRPMEVYRKDPKEFYTRDYFRPWKPKD